MKSRSELDLSTIVAVHKLCECIEISYFHAPRECKNDGDQTCVKCGRQCCSDCIYSDGLCTTCGGKK